MLLLLWLVVWFVVAIFGGFPHISFNHPDAWSITLAIAAYVTLLIPGNTPTKDDDA